MKIFLSWNVWFSYDWKKNSKVGTSYQRDILFELFRNINNYVSDAILKVISKKNYWEWLVHINVIFLCHSKKMIENLRLELWEKEYQLGFWDRFRHRWKEGGGFIRIDAEKFVDWDFTQRVELMFDWIKRATKEVKKIMDSRKTKKEFDIEAFFKDLDIAKENTLKIAKE